jgi:hypothetical protein
MSRTSRQGNIVLVSIAVFVLFAVSALTTEPSIEVESNSIIDNSGVTP